MSIFSIRKVGLSVSLFLFVILKQEDVTADLPPWVKRVSSCPIPNNLSDWMRASVAFKCSGVLNATKSIDLIDIYHCMPSSYLNESVQFCSNFTRIKRGSCAVYTYMYAPNTTPNSRNCTHFRSGCPEQEFFSNKLYKYKSCFDIDTKRKCYIQEPRCGVKFKGNMNMTTDEGSRDVKSTTVTNYVLGVLLGSLIVFLFIFLAVLWKRKKCGPIEIKQCRNQTVDGEVYGSHNRGIAKNEERIPLNEKSEEANELNEDQNKPAAREANELNEDQNKPAAREPKTDIDVQLACLNSFLYQIGGKLNKNQESVKMLKFILEAARKREIKMNKDSNIFENNKVIEDDAEIREIGGIKKGRDLLEFINRKYDLNLNFFKLEGFLKAVGEDRLCVECKEFNKENNQLSFCKGQVSKEGRKDLSLKLAGGKKHMNKDDLYEVQRDLSKSVNAVNDSDILMNGVVRGSIVIHFLVMNYLVDMLKLGNFEAMYKYGLIEVNLMGHCIYRGNNNGASINEMVCDQESTEFKETVWVCFKVSFEFVPRELAAHKRASEEIHSLPIGETDLPDDSVVFVHHNKSEIDDICLELFDSEPKIIEEYQFTSMKEVANQGHLVIFCYGEEAKNKLSYLIQSERNTVSEKVFFLILENKFLDWEFRKNAILKSLENIIDGRRILHSERHKEHLYETYCYHLEDQIKQLQEKLETSGSGRDLELAKEVRHIYEKVLKPNASISSALETECKHLIEGSDFLMAYMIHKNVIWVIGNPDLKKNEKPWPSSFEERIRNENMEIKYAHILRQSGTGYIEHEDKIRELGKCFWLMEPMVSVFDEMNVITLDDGLQLSAERHLHKSIEFFEGFPEDLLNQKVFKFGASTAMTKGFVDKVIVTSMGLGTAYGISPHPKNSVFSTEGDSGSVVFTKMNRTMYVIGLVFGTFEANYEIEDEEIGHNVDKITVVSNLQLAVSRLQKKLEGEIVDWRLKRTKKT